MEKTHLQRLKEFEMGMPIEEFILDYKRRGETTASAARRLGIPRATLHLWEGQFGEETRTYRLREREVVTA